MRNLFTRDISPYKTTFILYCILFVIALGVRLFFLYAIKTVFIFFKYIVFANQLVQGQDLGERLLDISPFYLTLMTFLVKYFNPEHLAITLLQLWVGVVNCLLIFTIGKQLFDRRMAFVSALLYAVYGNIIVQEATFEPLVFEILFNLLTVWFLLLSHSARTAPRGLLTVLIAGLWMGLGILTKPNVILFAPVAGLWLILPNARRDHWRQRLVSAGVFGLMMAAVVAPITVRNYMRFHDFVLVTADYGKVFFHGNARTADGFNSAALPNQDVDPTGKNDPDYAHVTFRVVAAQELGRPVRPSEAARFWFLLTLHDMAERPLDALKLELKKALLFFHAHEMFLVAHAFWEYKLSLAYPFLIRYSLIAPLALIGMALAVRRWKSLVLVYGGMLTFFLSCVLLLVTSRYRSPAAPYLCLFAGYAIVTVAQWFIQRRYRAVLLSLLAWGLLLPALTLPFRTEILRLEQSMDQVFRNSIQHRRLDPAETPALPENQE